jgi:hypothetical protein
MQYLEYQAAESVYKSDVRRMRAVLVSADYMTSENDLERLWDEYSSAKGNGWTHLPENDAELLEILLVGFGVGPMPEDEDDFFRIWPSHWTGCEPE